MASSRVTRGRQSEAVVAEYLRAHGFPQAERVAASLKGADVTGTPGLAIEIKSRYGLDLKQWMDQAAKREGLPLLVVRLNGQGPSSIANWPLVIPFGLGVEILREAGYGSPRESDGSSGGDGIS
jgi:hypothetical protein